MRALVTGATGFVGQHLVALLKAGGHEVHPFGAPSGTAAHSIDICDEKAVTVAVGAISPDVIFHLAAQSFVPTAIESPIATYHANIIGTAHIARAAADCTRISGKRPRLIFASSADVYGHVTADMLPLKEATRTNPANPYAASKAAGESILQGEYRSFGLDVVICRSFNAIGPGQQSQFAIPNFASQLAKVARGAPPRLAVGNLESQRDFLDVRDVASAYILLAEHGVAGETYNLCSGIPRSLRFMLDVLFQETKIAVEVAEDPSLMRPSDTPIVFGDNTKLRAATGWSAQIGIQTSLRQIYAHAFSR